MKIIKRVISIVVLIIIIIIIFLLIYFKKDIYMNYKILTSNNELLEMYDKDTKFILWERTYKHIINENILIKIVDGNNGIYLNNEEVKNSLAPETIINEGECEKYNMNEQSIIIEMNNPKMIKYININTKNIFENNQLVDIYTVDEKEEVNLYKEKIIIKNNEIDLDIDNNYNKYIITFIPIKEILIEPELKVKLNSKINMKFNISPINSTSKDLMIDIENKDIVSFNENGELIAKNVGETNVNIKDFYKRIEKNIHIQVVAIPEEIIVDKQKIELIETETTTISAQVKPTTIENKDVKFLSSDESIFKVNENGRITALKEGNAKLIIETIESPIITLEIPVNIKKKIIKQEETMEVSTIVQENTVGTYINGVLVVNKKYKLPSTYNPGVQPVAQNQFNQMKEDAKKEGINLWIKSGFRSYETQKNIYNRNVNMYGEEIANSFSAKPGESEHQTGLAFDINSTRWDFEKTIEAKWLENNCYKYGFIIRYPKGKEKITGYVYEPWHIRYVGIEHAKNIYNRNICLEEYLGID